jgi:mono/diheme cytochrome c family protein
MLKPMYVPQLAFRTGLAMVMAGGFLYLCILAFTQEDRELRARTTRTVSLWIVVWIMPCVLGGLWYASRVPTQMRTNLPVALVTQTLTEWSVGAMYAVAACGVVVGLIALVGVFAPRRIPRALLLVPIFATALVLGTFERVREFIRKPYTIAGYLYANGLRVEDYLLYQRDGLLKHATYTAVREVTARNELEAGEQVFALACTRCHTTDGVNGVRGLLANMYGTRRPWDVEAIDRAVASIHNVRPFMPPFPGNDDERHALAVYLVALQTHPRPLDGAQSEGVHIAPALTVTR